MARVLVPLVEAFEEIEAITIVDVLRRGNVEVVTASLGDGLEVTGAHGVVVTSDALLEEVVEAAYDAIVLPGGPGTPRYFDSQALIHRLVRQRDEQGWIAAICAAPAVLKTLGIIRATDHMTCYPTCAAELGMPVADAPCVRDGRLITGQAPGSALLFSLVVLEALVGEVFAKSVAHQMVTDVL